MALPIAPVAAVSPPGAGSPAGSAPSGFGGLVRQAVTGLDQAEAAARQALTGALTGHGTVTQAMIAVTAAQTAVDVAAAVRNATVQAAQSFFSMQI